MTITEDLIEAEQVNLRAIARGWAELEAKQQREQAEANGADAAMLARERAMQAVRDQLQAAVPTEPDEPKPYRPLSEQAIGQIIRRHVVAEFGVPYAGPPIEAEVYYSPRTGEPIPSGQPGIEDHRGEVVTLPGGVPVDVNWLRRLRWAPGRRIWAAQEGT